MPSRRLMRILGMGTAGRDTSRPARRASGRPGLESLEDRQMLSTAYVPGSVSGQGLLLNGKQSFSADTQAALVGGVASYSGKISFVDSTAGDTFTSTSISSIQVVETTPVVGPSKTNGYFTITGTATLNAGSSASLRPNTSPTAVYSFVASGSLPFPANTGSTGGLEFHAGGPNGFTYNTPWKSWDPGETVAITAAQPVLAATTTHLTSSANPSVYAQPVTFTATVSPSSPVSTVALASGTVSFQVGTGEPVNVQVVGGKAVFATTRLAVGSSQIVARYLGTSIYSPSQETITQTIGQANTATTLAYSGSFVLGQPLTLKATVAALSPSYDNPTGIVTFMDGDKAIGAARLDGTGTSVTATVSLSTGLPVGTHQITAVYGGDPNTAGSTSAVLTRTVAQLSTSTALTSTSPVVVGRAATLTATVHGGSTTSNSTSAFRPTGSVTFYDGTTSLGTVPINGDGVATLAATFSSSGSHALRAVYGGDTTFLGSTGTLGLSVQSAPTTPKVTLSASANPVVFGTTVTFTVTISPNGASSTALGGTITLKDGDTVVGTATVSSGRATFTSSTLSVGSHTLTAYYGGNSAFTSASSTPLTETVNAPVLGSVSGKGTTLGGQDGLTLDVHSALSAGTPVTTGSLTFSDSKAGDTFKAVNFTSLRIIVATPNAGAAGANANSGYFIITGMATLNGGTDLYSFTVTASVTFAPSTGTAIFGGMEFQATGPNGFSYSAPFKSWDAGESIIVKVST